VTAELQQPAAVVVVAQQLIMQQRNVNTTELDLQMILKIPPEWALIRLKM
jgi:hypothetical protein